MNCYAWFWSYERSKNVNLRPYTDELRSCTVQKVCGSWNQKLYIGEYSGTYSLKLKNSGIYNLRFAPS
jgi:hypothetical protein